MDSVRLRERESLEFVTPEVEGRLSVRAVRNGGDEIPAAACSLEAEGRVSTSDVSRTLGKGGSGAETGLNDSATASKLKVVPGFMELRLLARSVTLSDKLEFAGASFLNSMLSGRVPSS